MSAKQAMPFVANVKTEQRFCYLTGAPETRANAWVRGKILGHDISILVAGQYDAQAGLDIKAAAEYVARRLNEPDADEMLEALRQAWACIEHLSDHAPTGYDQDAALGTLNEIERVIAAAKADA